ncbi:hypothetical protein E2986_12931 [Frieseomelitta varia]|uniref:Uncharacterized protein n=1 Tax=Frieseomelitta varia TaxID=561572 RepID=A0A833VRG0_9HYME|nr:hypothetical protein E2986_12931 [Frieseomelitta varia]
MIMIHNTIDFAFDEALANRFPLSATFTCMPSITSEPFRTDFDRVYHAAEIMGRQGVSLCDSLFPECTVSPLDYFTEVVLPSFNNFNSNNIISLRYFTSLTELYATSATPLQLAHQQLKIPQKFLGGLHSTSQVEKLIKQFE